MTLIAQSETTLHKSKQKWTHLIMPIYYDSIVEKRYHSNACDKTCP